MFAVVIPISSESEFLETAAGFNLKPQRILRVKGTESSPTKRSLIEFTFQIKKLKTEELVIEIERHQYTPEYIELTKDFYLKM